MKRMKGFTLIELVITITVIIILSSISVPMYKGHAKNAMLAEGYVLLSAIRDAQKQYYSRYGNFLVSNDSCSGNNLYTCNEEVLGIDARGNKYFSWFSVGRLGTSERIGYYFLAVAYMPRLLQSSDVIQFGLQYNLSLGQRIVNYPKDSLDDWY